MNQPARLFNDPDRFLTWFRRQKPQFVHANNVSNRKGSLLGLYTPSEVPSPRCSAARELLHRFFQIVFEADELWRVGVVFDELHDFEEFGVLFGHVAEFGLEFL